MAFSKRITEKNLRSFLCISALFAVGVGGWACSSGSQQNSGASGNAGASSANGGSGTGGNGTGADAGQDNSGAGDGNNADGGANPGAGGSGNPSGGSGNPSGGSASDSGGSNASGSTGTAGTIGTGTTACDNGKDDDGDGLVDGFDPECTGPRDNDEGTFATGIPGDNSDPKWQDCFFDGNSGAGDDGCRYATGCLTGDLPQTDADCKLSAACIKFCAPLTQNGCDCFGCCTVQMGDGSSVDIVEASTCSIATIDDAKACPRCEKSTACGNECGECELCAGKTTLPASCSPPPGTGGSGSGGASATGGSSNVGGTGAGGTTGSGGASGGTGGVTHTCDGGEQVCGPGLAACSSSEYCSFGCCIIAVR